MGSSCCSAVLFIWLVSCFFALVYSVEGSFFVLKKVIMQFQNSYDNHYWKNKPLSTQKVKVLLYNVLIQATLQKWISWEQYNKEAAYIAALWKPYNKKQASTQDRGPIL